MPTRFARACLCLYNAIVYESKTRPREARGRATRNKMTQGTQ